MTLHAVQISFFVDPFRRAPQELLRVWPSLADVAEAAADGGQRVTVVQACTQTLTLNHRGIDYHFVAAAAKSARMVNTPAFGRLIHELKADVFHLHGLGFPDDVRALAQLAPRTPILIQDHADRPPRRWRRHRWRRGLAAATAVAFCARAQVTPFERAGLLPAGVAICEVPESSSRFTPGDRAEARRRTGVTGAPALLWVGHLDHNKDPLTVLEGVRRALPCLPGLELWCCYGKSPLMRPLQRRLEADPHLRARVHLLGLVPSSTVQELMRAADLFVLGSHREGSGYALIEALACGLPPIVPDIPSFRVLTGGGSVGRLWSRGDADSLRDALLEMTRRPLPPLRAAARAHFEAEVSFEAVGRKLAAAYQRSIELHASGESLAAVPQVRVQPG
jgi:glycosyltransferase involved in cell wall biosynthesis